ncbi:MAG: phosphoglycerate dehydrogenase [Symbiobacterium sp.]|uniref:phosphoglycerate dehydrogenase n=1 Tax=Symbiobacterium sp. TaxID=1971213 RepID=UPI00346472EE
MKILVTEAISETGISLLQAEHEVDVRKVTPEELLEIIPEYDALITRSETKVTAEVLARGARLKVVGRAGVGVDNVDVAAATERGVLVVNVPGANTYSTAEHAFGLLIAVARHIPQAHQALAREGRWDRKTFVGTELHGKTLGIIGLGRIGSEVAVRARAFGMKVLAYDPYVAPSRAEHLGVTLVESIRELLPQVDFLTIHAAKTSETARLIGAEELALMKPTARIVNCARGGMVDEEALYEALKEGRLAGAALDVFATEPCTASPLFTLPNVVVTPHLAASTQEAQDANGRYIAQYVLRALRGELVPEAVNLPQVPRDGARVVTEHLPLAETLGSFLAQAFPGQVDAITVTYSGELAKHPTALLTNTALKGFLATQLGDHVNYINAAALARRRGIAVRESKSLAHAPLGENGNGERLAAATGALSPEASLITVRSEGPQGAHHVTGMLRRDGGMRFVAVDGLPIDMAPTRHMLVSQHRDQPGMVGRFGMALAARDINIAGLHLGRHRPRGEALMLLQIDEPAPPDLVAELREAMAVKTVHAVTLPIAGPA